MNTSNFGKKSLIGLSLLTAVLAGCSKGENTVSDGWGEADVKSVTLKDGTRCAVLIGAYKGGITCDWDAR